MNRLKVARSAVTMALMLWGVLGASAASGKSSPGGKSQLAFGVDMARRGLWSEALFRFEQAKVLEPGSVSILNNLAICYEAGGRFEEALATYREALVLAPENAVVKQNYSRFAEFYQGFRPRKATPPTPGETPSADPVDPAEAPPAGSAPLPAGAPPDAPPPPASAPSASPVSRGGR